MKLKFKKKNALFLYTYDIILPTEAMLVQLNACPRWLYIEACRAQSRILQTQMHSESGKSAPNFENKRWHSMQRNEKWWLTTYLPTLLSEQSASEWTKMATSPAMPEVSSFGFLKLLTRFNKNQPTEIFYDLQST